MQWCKILGREVELPRFQQTYGMTYSFAGITCNAKEIPPLLQPYLDYANNDYADTSEFNGILVNWYEDGGQYVGYHSDNEKQLIKNSPIYCFSLGGTRTFKIKDKATKQVQSFKLNNGDLFIMGGTMQQTHLHTITKTVKPVGRRISITLRKFAE